MSEVREAITLLFQTDSVAGMNEGAFSNKSFIEKHGRNGVGSIFSFV